MSRRDDDARRLATWVSGLLLLLSGCGERPMAVFILAGQSNMGGIGRAEDVPPALARAYADARLLTERQRTWQPLAPQETRHVGRRFGPELTFAAAMSELYPDREIGVIKWTWGGSMISIWDPDVRTVEQMERIPEVRKNWLRKGPPFRGLIDTTRRLIDEEHVEVLGLMWMQGESDCSSAARAAEYEERLRTLMQQVRAQLGIPDLPIVIGLVNPEGRIYPRAVLATVRAAQEQVASEDPWIAVVSTDGLATAPDHVHYDSQGQLELGRRFASAYAELTRSRR